MFACRVIGIACGFVWARRFLIPCTVNAEKRLVIFALFSAVYAVSAVCSVFVAGKSFIAGGIFCPFTIGAAIKTAVVTFHVVFLVAFAAARLAFIAVSISSPFAVFAKVSGIFLTLGIAV